MKNKVFVLACFGFISLFLNCQVNIKRNLLPLLGLSISSSTRSNADSNNQTSSASTEIVKVISTTPIENDLGTSIKNLDITITFSGEVNLETLTTNTSNSTCSGTVQLSTNDFSTCEQIETLTLDSSKKILIIKPYYWLPSQKSGIKLKVTTGVKDTIGQSIQEFVMSTGFTTGTPCSASGNCFFSYRYSIAGSTGSGLLSIPIKAGIHSGKFLLVNGNANVTTNIIDEETGTSIAGPNLVNPASDGSLYIEYPNDSQGRVLIVNGNASPFSTIYNASTNSISSGPSFVSNVGSGSQSVYLTTGVHAGKQLIIHGSASNVTSLFDFATETRTAGVSAGGLVGGGSLLFPITSGPEQGKFLLIFGGGIVGSSKYNPSNDTFTSSGNPATTIGGTCNFYFPITAGTNIGKILFSRGFSTSDSLYYNQTTDSFEAGPSLISAIGMGCASHVIDSGINKGNVLLVPGNNTSNANLYVMSSNTVTSLPQLPTNADFRTLIAKVMKSIFRDRIVLLYTSSTASRIAYFEPEQNLFHTGLGFRNAVGDGSNNFLIGEGGVLSGNRMILYGNIGNATSYYNKTLDALVNGPNTSGSIGPGSISHTIQQGTNIHRTFIANGNSTASTQVYTPSTNSFGGSVSIVPVGIGSFSFYNTLAGAYLNRYIFFGGNGTNTSSSINLDIFSSGGGPNSAFSISGGTNIIPIPSGSFAGQQLIVSGGGGTTASRFNGTSPTLTSGLGALTTAVQSSQGAALINSGVNAGKILLIVGLSTTTTQIFDPTSNTFSAGPTLPNPAESWVLAIPITSGTNAGKILLVHANSNSASLYETNSNTFIPITTLVNSVSFGASYFPLNSKLFPTGIGIVHGGGAPAFSIYFP
ncbi:MAG: hypothetical protein SFU98_09675 [Leptospiraceae bacterium]|nr:hypothetical protein [Leptospiraceae bacterium]